MFKLRHSVFAVCVMLFSTGLFAEGSVDINTADVQTISAALKGIGPNKAEAIIKYRDEHGPFKSLSEIAQVKGIGDKIIEDNQGKITLGKKE